METMDRTRHLLIAVTGKTPQVITESAFALMVQRRIPIEAIQIITTAEGRRVIGGEEGLPPLKDELHRMCACYNLPVPEFDPATSVIVAREESVELHDIRSDRENVLFPNVVTDLIRRKTAEPGTVLHCSIAGGRKTMSVAMAFALSLFGRKKDTLYHVLAPPSFEQSRKFFPETEEESHQIVMAEIPYVRLREKLPMLKDYPHASFSQLVGLAQGVIDEMAYLPKLIFHRQERAVTIGEYRLRLRPFDFAFYLFCAKARRPIPAGKRFPESHWKKLLRLYNSLAPSAGQRERVRKTATGLDRDRLLTKSASTIRRVLTDTLGPGLARYYMITGSGQYGDIRYAILLDRAKIAVED